MGFPINTYQGGRNLSGKIISMKHNHQSNLEIFFQIAIFLLAYVATLSGQVYFRRSYFFTLFQSDYFDTTVNFPEQLFLQRNRFFRISFSRRVTYLQHFLFFQSIYFFRVKLLASSHFLRIVQLLFETATFLAEDLLGIKISTKLIYRCYCTASRFSEEQHFGKN